MSWIKRSIVFGFCMSVLLTRGEAQQFGVGAPQSALTFTPGIITTMVGTGVSGDTGDGGPASAAEVTNGIRGIAADAAGDVYFVDDTNDTVRVVYEGGATTAALIAAENAATTPQIGNIYRIAGVEASGGTPANGQLGSIALIRPGAGLAVDAAGDVYFNDTGTNKIWIIYAGGTNTTGTNLISLEAGVSAPVLGAIYAVAGGSATGAYTGDGSLATSSGVAFHGVNDMKFDAAGDMYIVDQGNNSIREVNAKTGILTTIAGGANGAGTAGSTGVNGPATAALLNSPYAVAIDAFNNVYIADKSNHLIKMIYEGGSQASALITLNNSKTVTTPVVGDIYTIVGGGSQHVPYGGLGTASALNSPTMVALDAAGNVYIADNSYYVVLEMNATTGIVTMVAGNGTAGYSGDGGTANTAELNQIRCVAVDAAGRMYITDPLNFRVREVSQGILLFVGEPVNTTSPAEKIVLSNTGNAALTFTGTPIFGGPNAADFAIDTGSSLNTCTQATLAPDSSCSLALTYTPAASGTSTATLSYATNGVISPQVITLEGELTPTTIALTPSANPAYPGQTVVLTASLSTSGGTPTGTITILQGTTTLGTYTLSSSGRATYTLPALGLGSYTFTAKYSGDNNFAASTSAVLTLNEDNFTVNASPTTISVVPGQATSTTLTLTGTGPSTQPVTFSCAAPSVLGCAFTPTSGTIPVAGTEAVTLEIGAVATTSNKMPRNSHSLYAFALFPFGALLMIDLRSRRRSLMAALGCIFCFAAVGLLSGCQQNNIGTPLASSTQTVMVTVSAVGSSTPYTQTVALTVNVQ